MHSTVKYEKRDVKKRILQHFNNGEWMKRNRENIESTCIVNGKPYNFHQPLNITWDSVSVSSFLNSNLQKLKDAEATFVPSYTIECRLLSEAMNAEEPCRILVDEHYERTLKVHAFKAFRRYALSKRTKRNLRTTADLWCKSNTLTCYLNKWICKMELKNDVHQKKWANACSHNRRQILLRHFCHWNSLIERPEHPGGMLLVAGQFRRTHYDRVLLTDTFSTWLMLFRKIQVAESMYRNKLLSQLINRWRRCIVLRGEKRYMQRVARLHLAQRTRRYWLFVWHQSLVEKRQLRVLDEQAIHFRRIRLLKVCLHGWRQQNQEHLLRIKDTVKQIETKVNQSRLRTAWFHWRAYVQRCQRDKTIVTRIGQLRNVTVIRNCFRAWVDFTQQWLEEQDRVVHNHRKNMQRRQLKKNFDYWRHWVIQHRQERTEAGIAESTLRERSGAVLKRYTLKRWRQTLELQIKSSIAEQHASVRLIHNCFQSWRKACALRHEKLQMQLAADRFRSVTLRAEALRIWQFRYKESCRLRQLDSLALCRWALCLQARAWSAWREWFNRRRTKRARQARAFDRYWEHRAQVAFGAMIEAATIKRQERHAIFCQQYWDSDRRMFQLALNCATRWRFWTARRVEQRLKSNTDAPSETPVPPDPSRNSLSVSPLAVLPRTMQNQENGCSELTCAVVQSSEAFDVKPRYPEFLVSHLKTQGLIHSDTLSVSNPEDPFVSASMGNTKLKDASEPEQSELDKQGSTLIEQLVDDTNELLEKIQIYRMQRHRLSLYRLQRELHATTVNSKKECIYWDRSTEESYRNLRETVRQSRHFCRNRLCALMESTLKLQK